MGIIICSIQPTSKYIFHHREPTPDRTQSSLLGLPIAKEEEPAHTGLRPASLLRADTRDGRCMTVAICRCPETLPTLETSFWTKRRICFGRICSQWFLYSSLRSEWRTMADSRVGLLPSSEWRVFIGSPPCFSQWRLSVILCPYRYIIRHDVFILIVAKKVHNRPLLLPDSTYPDNKNINCSAKFSPFIWFIL